MTDEQKKVLTEEVLKEEWHVPEWRCCDCGRQFTPNKSPLIEVPICAYCGSPNKDFVLPLDANRTFDNRNDLLDLYEVVYEDGKWDDFFWDFAFQRKPENYGLGEAETSVWLFCLDGKDYEARCKMVAEFYGWKGEK